MKNFFTRTISLICAVTLLICALSVCAFAEETPATPTDLPEKEETTIPEGEKDEEGEPEVADQTEDGSEENSEEDQEEPAESVEILITKNMKLGDTWEGVARNTHLAILKLDVEAPQTVHLILEGNNAWASVQKSDRLEEEPKQIPTDAETKLAVISWEAEQGSYLITVGPVAPNIMAKASATVLDDEAFATWEEEQAAADEEPDEEETGEEPAVDNPEEGEPADETEKETEVGEENEDKPEEENTDELEEENVEEPAPDDNEEEPEAAEDEGGEPEEDETAAEEEPLPELPEDRSITIQLEWLRDETDGGNIAHFTSSMIGYERANYTLQWQVSSDLSTWTDYTGATEETLDVRITKELYGKYWRLMVYVEEPQR